MKMFDITTITPPTSRKLYALLLTVAAISADNGEGTRILSRIRYILKDR